MQMQLPRTFSLFSFSAQPHPEVPLLQSRPCPRPPLRQRRSLRSKPFAWTELTGECTCKIEVCWQQRLQKKCSVYSQLRCGDKCVWKSSSKCRCTYLPFSLCLFLSIARRKSSFCFWTLPNFFLANIWSPFGSAPMSHISVAITFLEHSLQFWEGALTLKECQF